MDCPTSFLAQDIAGKAILFEIGSRVGILEHLEDSETVSPDLLADNLKLDYDFLETYLNIFESLGLVTKLPANDADVKKYQKTQNYHIERNKIGYIAWGMISCAPLITNADKFVSDFDTAIKAYQRCGEHVALTSKWMGAKDFYPHALEVILKTKPKKIVDLGSGTCGLLIKLTEEVPGLNGIGVDISKDACDKARDHIASLKLQDQIEVIQAPIQELVNQSTVFENADIVHAGFVFHDLMPDHEEELNQLLACISRVSPGVTLLVVDAVPFSQNDNERAFSSAFSFLHKYFMGRQLQSESVWTEKLKKNGFSNVKVEPLGISGGRIFIAKTK